LFKKNGPGKKQRKKKFKLIEEKFDAKNKIIHSVTSYWSKHRSESAVDIAKRFK
jgi:hypothetical protein